MARRVAITGMSAVTPLADELDAFLEALLAGRSALTRWRSVDTERIYCKVGADLGDYDVRGRAAALAEVLPEDMAARLRRLTRRSPWSTALSCILAADAWRDAALHEDAPDPWDTAVLAAGHNLNAHYIWKNHQTFAEEPDWIDNLMSVHALDTDQAASISEVLGSRGAMYTVGGACASGNAALRAAVDEVRHHDAGAVVVVGTAVDFSPVDLHAMALMGSISWQTFNDEPHRASRPFDTGREGFVPAHGGAALVLEDLERARARGARVYAEVLGVEACSDATHLPAPSEEGQAHAMSKVLRRAGVAPEEVGFVCAHATSTPLGDKTELRSIKRVFGDHAHRLRVNAPKSMLGHTCWAAPLVETVAAVLQLRAGRLHPSINIDDLDPEVDLDVCRHGPVPWDGDTVLKNSFGFGGINVVSLLRRLP